MEPLLTAIGCILLAIIAELLYDKFAQKAKEPINSIVYSNDKDNTKLALFMWTKAEYLSSKEWRLKRIQVKERDNYACQLCGATEDLHVHHMSGYDLIPNEPLDCLITLCNTCHKSEHEKVSYPKSYSDYMSFNHPIKKLK